MANIGTISSGQAGVIKGRLMLLIVCKYPQDFFSRKPPGKQKKGFCGTIVKVWRHLHRSAASSKTTRLANKYNSFLILGSNLSIDIIIIFQRELKESKTNNKDV